MEFRQRVRMRLAYMGMTQASFARAIGMDPAVLSRALSSKNPRRSTVLKITKGLDIEVTEPLINEDRVTELMREHRAFEGLKPGAHREEVLAKFCKKKEPRHGNS